MPLIKCVDAECKCRRARRNVLRQLDPAIKAERRRLYHHNWYLANREKKYQQYTAWRKRNPKRNSEISAASAKRHRGTINATARRIYKENINHRLARSLRKRLASAVKRGDRGNKGCSAVRDLGCSVAELRGYLESQFQPGMTWSNHAMDGWHIDHKIPLASFDLQNAAEARKACHFTNLQPLWATENLKKGAKHV